MKVNNHISRVKTGRIIPNAIQNVLLTLSFLCVFLTTISGKVFAGKDLPSPQALAVTTDSLESLINGRFYHFQSVRNGQPYFNDQNWVRSPVATRYETFKNVLIKYDIYQDVLITPVYTVDGTYAVALNSQYIKSFYLDMHYFVNLNNTLENCATNYPGYFELLYDGQLKMLIKWRKLKIDEDKVSGGDFEVSKTIYLLRDGTLHQLKSNRSLLRLFPGHKKEIRTYLNNNQVYLKKSTDDTLKKITKYIDQLTD